MGNTVHAVCSTGRSMPCLSTSEEFLGRPAAGPGRQDKAEEGHWPWGLGALGQVTAACFSPSRASNSAREISFFPVGLSFRGLGHDLKGRDVGDDGEPTGTSCWGVNPSYHWIIA